MSTAEPVLAAPPNPLLRLWLHPRETIRRLVESPSRWHVFVLGALSGIGTALDNASTRGAGDEFPLAVVVGACIGLGSLLGVVMVYATAAIFWLIGRWDGRSATNDELRVVSAWANVPSVFGLLLWIPMYAMLGREMFSESMPTVESSIVVSRMLLGIGVVQVALAAWSFVIVCKGIAEVQMLTSSWRGFVHVLAAASLVIIPVYSVILAYRFLG